MTHEHNQLTSSVLSFFPASSQFSHRDVDHVFRSLPGPANTSVSLWVSKWILPKVSGQGLTARAHPTTPGRSRTMGALGAAPAPDIRHLPGHGSRSGYGPMTGLGLAKPMARHGRVVGELDTGAATALLGQGLVALGR